MDENLLLHLCRGIWKMKKLVFHISESGNPKVSQIYPLLDSVYQHSKILSLIGWLV